MDERQGEHRFQYAVLAHKEDWPKPASQRAWEYNCPVIAVPGLSANAERNVVETSDNLLVEALRREGDEIELRMVECLGQMGSGSVEVKLPHSAAWQTDLRGQRRVSLPLGSKYHLQVRPQEIVTLRFRTSDSAPRVAALTSFEPLIPAAKREHMRSEETPS